MIPVNFNAGGQAPTHKTSIYTISLYRKFRQIAIWFLKKLNGFIIISIVVSAEFIYSSCFCQACSGTRIFSPFAVAAVEKVWGSTRAGKCLFYLCEIKSEHQNDTSDAQSCISYVSRRLTWGLSGWTHRIYDYKLLNNPTCFMPYDCSLLFSPFCPPNP